MAEITVVGGGLAGLVASITCAEAGAPVRLLEAHRLLGGRARSSTGEFAANLGPHVVYDNGRMWPWLAERGIVADAARAPLVPKVVFRSRGRVRRVPPAGMLRAARVLRRPAPVDIDWRTWVAQQTDAATAEIAARAVGVFTFDADPGRLSAAFVAERARQSFALPPRARYVPGGWQTLIDGLAARAADLGVRIETGVPVTEVPRPPVIVATDLAAARRLLGDDSLVGHGTRTMLLDVGLTARRRDPFIVWDLDEGGWVERFSRCDTSLAPEGHVLFQAQLGLRSDESLEDGLARIERLLDAGVPSWRAREVWRRRSVIENSTGALDLPGQTWRDRPSVERGGGVYLTGDMVAAPGLLSDVSFTSAVQAAELALRSRREVLLN